MATFTGFSMNCARRFLATPRGEVRRRKNRLSKAEVCGNMVVACVHASAAADAPTRSGG